MGAGVGVWEDVPPRRRVVSAAFEREKGGGR